MMRCTILVVDDEPAIHRALQLALRREPYDLLHAYDAAEAWHLIEGRTDIGGVICDHDMPGMPGVDLLICIQEHHPELPTVLLSARASMEVAANAVNNGHVRALFTKPWQAEDLRAGLRKAFLGTSGASAMAPELKCKLLRETLPARDPATGAFIIGDESVA